MRRFWKWSFGFLALCNVMAVDSRAQFMFPGGFGGFGMSEWGANPSAGYMAGLGAFARGKGAYLLDKAQADAINVETMTKWNKALRARQAVVRKDQEEEAARRQAAREERVERRNFLSGTTLNRLLAEIFDRDPTAAMTGRANTPISRSAIREIPFEWDSEAISLCLDQMSGQRSIPPALMAPIYDEERRSLQAAVHAAWEEDAKGTVSMHTVKRVNEAVAQLRAKFLKNVSRFDSGRDDALTYLTTVASLSRMLNDPSMRQFLEKLQGDEQQSVGNLIAFMDAYNLRFGPATSERQIEIYNRLVPLLTAIRDSARNEPSVALAPDQTGDSLQQAAKDAFKSMKWEHLEAHARDQ